MKKLILIAISILLLAGQAGAEDCIKPYHVTWQMMEAHSVPCPDFRIDDYGRKIFSLGCLVAHFKWGGPYTGDRCFDSLDEAIAFIKEKQDNWGFPQKTYDFKILWDKEEIIFPNPERLVLDEKNSGATGFWFTSGVTGY